MQKSLVLLIFSSLLCGCQNPTVHRDALVQVAALPTEDFGKGFLHADDGCSFQIEFVRWFTVHYAPDLKPVRNECGESNADNLPAEMIYLKDRCARVCTAQVFGLARGSRVYTFYSIVSTTDDGRSVGVLGSLGEVNFELYEPNTKLLRASIDANAALAPSLKVPLMGLTFLELLNQRSSASQ